MYAVGSLVCALVGAFLFDRLNVPAGVLVGAMVGAGGFNLISGMNIEVTKPVTFFVFAVLGWMIGSELTHETIKQMVTVLPLAGVVVLSLVAFGGFLAYLGTRFGPLDPVTAFLATAPGGVSQMAGLAAATGSNVVLVTAFHVARIISVVLLTPLVIKLVSDR